MVVIAVTGMAVSCFCELSRSIRRTSGGPAEQPVSLAAAGWRVGLVDRAASHRHCQVKSISSGLGGFLCILTIMLKNLLQGKQ